MNRRNFLQTLVAAPAIVKASSLMKITPVGLLVPEPLKIIPSLKDKSLTELLWPGVKEVWGAPHLFIGDLVSLRYRDRAVLVGMTSDIQIDGVVVGRSKNHEHKVLVATDPFARVTV